VLWFPKGTRAAGKKAEMARAMLKHLTLAVLVRVMAWLCQGHGVEIFGLAASRRRKAMRLNSTRVLGATAVVLAAVAFGMWSANAQEVPSAPASTTTANNPRIHSDARDLLKAMSDFMSSHPKLSFAYQSTIEAVSDDMQKLQFVSSGNVVVNRPDKIRVTRTGGLVDSELVFDGSMLSILGKNINAYAQIEEKGTLDDVSDRLGEAGLEPPGADLLATDSFDALMNGVTDAKRIATAHVQGVECEFIAFRKDDVDFQLWIAKGGRPVPMRYVITSKLLGQAPQYTIETRDWKFGDEVAAADFSFTPPGSAKKVDLTEVSMFNELPKPGQTQP
jgi:hypothetical protein